MTMNPVMVARGDGERFNFMNTLHTAKITGEQTNGTVAAVEFVAPKNFGPPLHRHEAQDELFYIIDGELWLACGDAEAVHGQGAVVWLPRGLTHSFQVRSDTARVLVLTMPAGFEEFVATVGEPLGDRPLPEPVELDLVRLTEICAQFGIEVIGPPAPPVD